MSRSRKKSPVIKIGSGDKKQMKRFANKKVRRTGEIPDGRQFRKLFQTWDINDARCRGFNAKKEDIREYTKK